MVYDYTDGHHLADLFAKIAACDTPWQGTERWESLEGEFALEAKCSTVGEVTLDVRLSSECGGPEAWRVSARIVTEMGQLPRIARDAGQFFRVVSGV